MDVGEIGALLHQAAMGNASWIDALQAIASFTNSARGQLIGLTAPAVDFNWVTSFDDEAFAEFEQINGGDPALNFRIAAGLASRPMQVVHEAHYELAKRDVHDPIYLEFCERHEIPWGCQTILMEGNAGFVGLAALRTHADGPTRWEDRRAFNRLLPHVRSAVELQWAIENQGQKLLLGSFDAIGKAAFFLDSRGRALAWTTAADEVLSRLGVVRIKHHRILCDHPRMQAMLDQAIGAVLSGRLAEAMAVLYQDSLLPVFATVQAFNPPETNIGFRPRAILMLRSAADDGGRIDAWLRFVGLTAAEIEIAKCLAQGLERQAIADQRGARISTVRQQIKTIFSKLGVHREAELVAMLGQASLR